MTTAPPSTACGTRASTRGRADGEEAEVEFSGRERCGRCLLDGQVAVAEAHTATGRAGAGEGADALEASFGQQL